MDDGGEKRRWQQQQQQDRQVKDHPAGHGKKKGDKEQHPHRAPGKSSSRDQGDHAMNHTPHGDHAGGREDDHDDDPG